MTDPQIPDIVKKADPQIPPRDGATLVFIESRSRRTRARRPWLPLPLHTWNCFHVDTKRAADIGPIRHRVEDFQGDRRVELKITGRMRCIVGEEAKAVAALFGDSGVTATFETLVIAAIDDALNEREGAFIDAFVTKAPDLAKTLQERARASWGMMLNLKIGLDNDDMLGPITIGPRQFTVSVIDSQRELPASLSAELGVLKSDPVTALMTLQKPDVLADTLVQTIRKHCRDSVTLHAIYFERDAVQGALKNELTAIIRSHGREPDRLVVTFADPEFSTNTVELIHTTSYEPSNIAGTVHVESKVRLKLVDASLYVKAGAPNLDVWLRDQLQQIVGHHLFEAGYVDLVLDWAPLETAIRQDLTARIEAIGHELRALISGPDLPDRQLATFNDVHLDIDTFDTAMTAEVRIDTAVTLRISDLSLIRERLVRREDILAEIKRRATSDLRNCIRTIEPERFYMEFSSGNDGRSSIQELLVATIRQGLAEEFPVDIRQVSIRPLNDALTDRLIRLKAYPAIDFRVEVLTVGKIGTGPVVLEGAFRIGGVHPKGWHNFQSLTDETDSKDVIREQLDKAVLAGLQVRDMDVLLFDTEEKQATVRKWIQDILDDAALMMFGLSVQLMHVRRDRSLTEETYASILIGENEVEKTRLEAVKVVGVDHYTAIADRHRAAQDAQTDSARDRAMLGGEEEAKAVAAEQLQALRRSSLLSARGKDSRKGSAKGKDGPDGDAPGDGPEKTT